MGIKVESKRLDPLHYFLFQPNLKDRNTANTVRGKSLSELITPRQ